jgi:glyoxylase-like metal-dependent hydrolase (beta-lactamase superfamily II)
MKSTRILAAMASSLACALLVPATGFAVEPSHSAALSARNLKDSDFPRWQKIAPGVYAYEGLHSPDKDGTVINTVSLIVVTTDGVTIVDGQGDAKQTQLLVDNVKKLTAQPIKNVVIASDHGDHTGGNAAFKAAYPEVVFISSPASQKTLAKNENPPTVTVADKRVLAMGKTEIQILNLGRAHTGGDLVVYLPQTKVLFMSEVYLHDVFPAMRSAYPSEWRRSARRRR